MGFGGLSDGLSEIIALLSCLRTSMLPEIPAPDGQKDFGRWSAEGYLDFLARRQS